MVIYLFAMINYDVSYERSRLNVDQHICLVLQLSCFLNHRFTVLESRDLNVKVLSVNVGLKKKLIGV